MSFSTPGAFSRTIVVRVEAGGADDYSFGYQKGESVIFCLRCEEDELPILRCDSSNGDCSKVDLCKACILELFDDYDAQQQESDKKEI